MHFAVDGTLWEGLNPDLYDKMAGSILRDLSLRGARFTLLGKTQDGRPLALEEASDGLAWQRAPEKMGDRLLKEGWIRKAVPRAVREAGLGPWISWEGKDIGSGFPQWLFLKGVSDLLWPSDGGPSSGAGKGPGAGKAPGAGWKSGARWRNLLDRGGTGIITFSEGAAAYLRETFGAGAGAVRVLPAFYPSGLPVASWEEKEQAKAAYSGGKEYFLWIGSPGKDAHWMEALKAFSIFKRGQRSHMQLLMAPWEKPGEEFLRNLASYKYRADVQVIDRERASWQTVFRSAYAVLYIPRHDELGWVAGMAMELEVPLISTRRSIAMEWAGETALWVDPASPDSVAGAMVQIYKDEAFRGWLLDRGRATHPTRTAASFISQYEQVLTSAPGQ